MKPAAKLVLAVATGLLAGCGVPGIPRPPSLELPQPVSDLRAVRKGDRVYLSWTVPAETTDGLAIRQLGVTRVCRTFEKEISACGTPANVMLPLERAQAPAKKRNVAATPTKITAEYTDRLPVQLPTPDTGQLTYAVEVLNSSDRSAGLSNDVHVLTAPTLPPPAGFSAEVTGGGVVLHWTAPAMASPDASLGHLYRVYRRQGDSNTDMIAAEVPWDTFSAAPVVDHGFEWGKTYYYRATVVTVVTQPGKPDVQIEGDDTPAVKVYAEDVFPPAVPSGLQAVFSGAGQAPFVDLIWAPDTDPDLAGYNVYRHDQSGEAVKINSDLVKEPAFRDTAVSAGTTYFYSVSAVDVRGNESARSQETSEAVP